MKDIVSWRSSDLTLRSSHEWHSPGVVSFDDFIEVRNWKTYVSSSNIEALHGWPPTVKLLQGPNSEMLFKFDKDLYRKEDLNTGLPFRIINQLMNVVITQLLFLRWRKG